MHFDTCIGFVTAIVPLKMVGEHKLQSVFTPICFFSCRRNSSNYEWTKEKLDSVARSSKDFPDSKLVNYLSAEVGVNITLAHCPSMAVNMSFYSTKTGKF